MKSTTTARLRARRAQAAGAALAGRPRYTRSAGAASEAMKFTRFAEAEDEDEEDEDEVDKDIRLKLEGVVIIVSGMILLPIGFEQGRLEVLFHRTSESMRTYQHERDVFRTDDFRIYLGDAVCHFHDPLDGDLVRKYLWRGGRFGVGRAERDGAHGAVLSYGVIFSSSYWLGRARQLDPEAVAALGRRRSTSYPGVLWGMWRTFPEALRGEPIYSQTAGTLPNFSVQSHAGHLRQEPPGQDAGL